MGQGSSESKVPVKFREPQVTLPVAKKPSSTIVEDQEKIVNDVVAEVKKNIEASLIEQSALKKRLEDQKMAVEVQEEKKEEGGQGMAIEVKEEPVNDKK